MLTWLNRLFGLNRCYMLYRRNGLNRLLNTLSLNSVLHLLDIICTFG